MCVSVRLCRHGRLCGLMAIYILGLVSRGLFMYLFVVFFIKGFFSLFNGHLFVYFRFEANHDCN